MYFYLAVPFSWWCVSVMSYVHRAICDVSLNSLHVLTVKKHVPCSPSHIPTCACESGHVEVYFRQVMACPYSSGAQGQGITAWGHSPPGRGATMYDSCCHALPTGVTHPLAALGGAAGCSMAEHS